MKKVFFILIAAIFLLSFSACEHSVDYTRGGFAIYMFADSRVAAFEAAQQPLNALNLAQSPIISVDDIDYYKWRDHIFSLKPSARDKLKSIAKRLRLYGRPFVVVANNERIYLGAFWAAFFSSIPSFPQIDVTLLPTDATVSTLGIAKAWIENEPDLRNDPRIYTALKSAGVLIE
ncbi:hypothetical protein L0244_26865 [bacterium]|nr:hypothetical protein [bacterium]